MQGKGHIIEAVFLFRLNERLWFRGLRVQHVLCVIGLKGPRTRAHNRSFLSFWMKWENFGCGWGFKSAVCLRGVIYTLKGSERCGIQRHVYGVLHEAFLLIEIQLFQLLCNICGGESVSVYVFFARTPTAAVAMFFVKMGLRCVPTVYTHWP